MNIVDKLYAEHRLLWVMMEALAQGLTRPLAADALRERAAMLAVGIEDHAMREERLLFDPLRESSEVARHMIDMMSLVHDEVRGLVDELQGFSGDPSPKIWTLLQLTDEHFVTEEEELFPLARAVLGAERLAELGAADQPAQSLFKK